MTVFKLVPYIVGASLLLSLYVCSSFIPTPFHVNNLSSINWFYMT